MNHRSKALICGVWARIARLVSTYRRKCSIGGRSAYLLILGVWDFGCHGSADSSAIVEPAQFKFMLPGYCYAGNVMGDTNSVDGYGPSENFPLKLPKNEIVRTNSLYFQLIRERPARFQGKYEGFVIRLVIGGNTRRKLSAQDSRISITQEALGKDGRWHPIEHLPPSWCAISYQHVYLKSKLYWWFNVPKYSGPKKTKLRFALMFSKDQSVYSEPFDGGVHFEQFRAKKQR